MLYCPFSCCGSIATLPEPQFLLLPTVTCAQSDHVPKSTAKMQKSQLWTLITFFWFGFVTPYFTTNLIYIYRSFIQSLLRYCAAKKKSFFYYPGLIIHHVIFYLGSQPTTKWFCYYRYCGTANAVSCPGSHFKLKLGYQQMCYMLL